MMKEFEYTGKAMGTEYSVAIVTDSEAVAKKMLALAKRDIEDYETRFSRFIPTSELSILNDRKTMVVSQAFLDVTQKAYQLFTETGGIFNPLVQIARLGYDKTFDSVGNPQSGNMGKVLDDSPYDIDFSATIIDQQTSRIHLEEGQKLDYGGFLKGYLAELIAKKITLASSAVSGVVVNLGGDIYTQGLDEHGHKFIFHIYNPILDNDDTSVSLYNQSLATSGTYKRSWLQPGKPTGKLTHHILDASGKQNPHSDVVSASVIHSDGAKAESYAKVFLAVSHDTALKILANEPISFVLIKNNGTVINKVINYL